MSNLYESLIGNFEDIVQYNKDNKAFEGGKHDNVTIETLCDIMAGGDTTHDEEKIKEMSEFDEMASFLKETFLNRFDREAPKKKTSLEYFADVNELYLKIHDQECFDVGYDDMIKDLREVSFNKNIGGRQWIYQTCTEFGWYQSSDQPGHPFTDRFPVQFSEKQCADIFGPEFDADLLERGIARSNVVYGGRNVKVSNVVFVHGSIDPWHALGITRDVNEEATAIFIEGTAHCANMYPERPEDPPQLKRARQQVMLKIKEWLQQH